MPRIGIHYHYTPRQVVRWTAAQWRRWTRKYRRECQRLWHGRFWLMTPSDFNELDFTNRGTTYRPNVWCRFRLSVVDSSATAHQTIRCVRLAPSVPFFRSHSRLYDHRDLQPRATDHGAPGLTHVHEVGHLLGLGHSAEHRQQCQVTGDTNSPPCYGVTEDEQRDIMGSGSVLQEWHAQPWRDAIAEMTGTLSYEWGVLMRRSYPRTLDDVRRNIYHPRRPRRG